MSSLTESDVLDVEGLARFGEFCLALLVGKRKHDSFLVSRPQDGRDLLHRVASGTTNES